MKIINETDWRTDDLKAILQRCAEQEFDDGARRKKLKVTVIHTKDGTGCSGYAYYHAHTSVVRIGRPAPRPMVKTPVEDLPGSFRYERARKGQPLTEPALIDLKLQFASVACHEFAHNRGMKHRQMPGYYSWSGNWKPYVAWASGMPLRPKPVKAQPSRGEQLDVKLQHAVRMLKAAETRYRRAATWVKKWRQRARRYDLLAAAAKAPPTESAE